MAKIDRNYIRSSVFGFEDALVSTSGVVLGIMTGTSNRAFIILAACVTIAVEAVSMGAGQYLSERTLHEIEPSKHKDNLIVGSVIMFASYFLGGLIPIFPVFFFPLDIVALSVLLFTFSALFALGYIKGKIVRISPRRSAIEMLLIGGAAAIIGIVAGYFLRI